MDGIVGRRIQKKVKDNESGLTDTHKVELLKLINVDRQSNSNRLEDTYRTEETRERVRKNIGDWSNQYSVALYGMPGYDEKRHMVSIMNWGMMTQKGE
ncbi:hypothetical protein O9929_27385 [Vibrio lentus]|nr:hypothetical protein [Vibrio lentus]